MGKSIHEKIISEIVNGMTRLMGPVAILQANNIKGLKVTANGDVDIKGNPAKKIERLVDGYEVLIGPAAIMIAKKAVKPFIVKNKGLKIIKKLK